MTQTQRKMVGTKINPKEIRIGMTALYKSEGGWIELEIKGLPDCVNRVPAFSALATSPGMGVGKGKWYCLRVSALRKKG